MVAATSWLIFQKGPAARTRACVYVCVRLCVYVRVSVCMSVYESVYVYVCVCVYIPFCVKYKSQQWGGPGPSWALAVQEKNSWLCCDWFYCL